MEVSEYLGQRYVLLDVLKPILISCNESIHIAQQLTCQDVSPTIVGSSSGWVAFFEEKLSALVRVLKIRITCTEHITFMNHWLRCPGICVNLRSANWHLKYCFNGIIHILKIIKKIKKDKKYIEVWHIVECFKEHLKLNYLSLLFNPVNKIIKLPQAFDIWHVCIHWHYNLLLQYCPVPRVDSHFWTSLCPPW